MLDTSPNRSAGAKPAGDYLRTWRQRRRKSQLELAVEAEISQRHLSFLESGRSVGSREMLLRLAERLEVPLRERNAMLLAAGYAPVYPESSLDDPALESARQAIDRVLRAHEPYPALAVDRHWNLVSANAGAASMLDAVLDRALLARPLNVLRLSLHPAGLAPRIANLSEWREHLFDRLRRQIAATADPALSLLLEELASYPTGDPSPQRSSGSPSDPPTSSHGLVFVPLEWRSEAGILSFISTTTLFGAPRDITLAELAVEAFFPANAATAERLRQRNTD
jgi:transcriptional regulator with XRE-family HTH domain